MPWFSCSEIHRYPSLPLTEPLQNKVSSNCVGRQMMYQPITIFINIYTRCYGVLGFILRVLFFKQLNPDLGKGSFK